MFKLLVVDNKCKGPEVLYKALSGGVYNHNLLLSILFAMGTHVSFMFTGDFNHISGDRNLHFSHGLLGSKGAGKKFAL